MGLLVHGKWVDRWYDTAGHEGHFVRSAAKFRKQKEIPFPLFADEKREIFECLGKPVLPVSYLVQRQAGKRKIRLIQSGHIGSAEKLLAEIKSAVAGD